MPNGDQDTDRRGHRRDRSPTRSATTQNSHRSSKPAAAQMTRPVETQVDLRTRTPYQKPLSQEEESEIYKAMRNLNLHVDAKGKEYVRGDLDEQNLTQEGGAPVTKPELGPKRNVVKGYDVMKHTPEVKAARFRTKARALEEKDAQASLEPSFANKSAASSRRRQSSMEEPYPPKTAERRYSNTSSRLSPESQRPSRPGPSQTLEHARSFSRSPPRDHAPSRSSYKSTATLEPDTPRDYSPPREENSKARRSLRPRHQQSDDRAYSRTRSPERMSRQPRSEKSRKKSTRRYSKSRSPIRKKGALRPSDPRTTKANDGSLGPGENFRDSVESYPPPPINPFIDGLMPSYGQYPPTQFPSTAYRQYPTPSIPTTVRGSPNAYDTYNPPPAPSMGSGPPVSHGNYPPPSPLNTAYYTNPPPPNPSYWYDEYGQIQYY